MSLEINFFEKKQVLYNFAFFFFFVQLLLIFINERTHNTLSVFDEGAIKHTLASHYRAALFIGSENASSSN